MNSYLIKKKPKKPAILGKILNFSEYATVLRHNFFCRGAILIWKVALESLYKQLSSAILVKFGPRGPRDQRYRTNKNMSL